MIDLEQQILITLNSSTINYYKNKGYNIGQYLKKDKQYRLTIPKGTQILVKVKDLPIKSNVFVEVQCDYCGKKYLKRYSDYNKNLKTSFIKKNCCEDCKEIKIIETFNLKYNVDSPMQLQIIKDKFKNTDTKNLGVRFWICPECNIEHDRDENAAINILNQGLKDLGLVS